MSEPRLPILPRVGYIVLTVLFCLMLAAFVLLFFAVPDERWTFLLPAVISLAGLSWTRNHRRGWRDRHRAGASS